VECYAVPYRSGQICRFVRVNSMGGEDDSLVGYSTKKSVSRLTFHRCILPVSSGDEMSVSFSETTRVYTPEGCHLHTHCCENLKSP
jgi:hypothetical protein